MENDKIFISYRRADTAGHAGRLFDRLNERFPNQVLLDVKIPPGVNFVEWIEEQINSCRVFIEVIGNQWSNITDHNGKRRLDDPADHVRGEICSALRRAAKGNEKLTIIPILVEGAEMPDSATLPPDIAAISLHNALVVTEINFEHDIERLINQLKAIFPPKKSRRPVFVIATVLSILVLLGVTVTWLNSPVPGPQPNDRGVNNNSVTPNPSPKPTETGPVLFVNSKTKLDGKLAVAYVDFSFYYPNNWRSDPNAGVPGARSFVRVERRLPWDMTQESFTVGPYLYDHDHPEKRAQEISNLSSALANQIPEYRKVSENFADVGIYKGYEIRFEGMSRNTQQGDIRIWGRTILLPPVDEGKNGVTLLILATSLAPELKSLDDVGEKGEARTILQSFRFGGAPQPAP